MAKNEIIKATVSWSYPRKFENAKETELSYEGYGVYCISRIFGDNETILYIGKTAVQFKGRLDSHEYEWLSDYKGKKIVRFGTITIPETVSRAIINDIESGLIHEVQPIHNVDKKNSYTFQAEYLIHNIGYRGLLPKIVDMSAHQLI